MSTTARADQDQDAARRFRQGLDGQRREYANLNRAGNTHADNSPARGTGPGGLTGVVGLLGGQDRLLRLDAAVRLGEGESAGEGDRFVSFRELTRLKLSSIYHPPTFFVRLPSCCR